MSLISRLEQRLEGLIEGAFARTFRGRVHPTEIADRIVREIEDHRTVGISAVYVPNEFMVELHPEDLTYLEPLREAMTREIEQHVKRYVQQRGYRMVGGPRVVLTPSQGGPPGVLQVKSRMVECPPRGLLRGLAGPVAGLELRLEQDCTRLGRAPENDLVIDDHNLSRTHAQLLRRKQEFVLVDLGSTNGTYVNGRKITQAILQDGDEIAVGLSRLQFNEG